ncbi:hypothetical protein CBR_g38025 [Chara braunii]|uniref:Uncharacterized protein n=1 Tax=Chara braunii TaxID=69332 RepID=A0A388K036_CHABU|nr:hypothetical protein CBR_g38025 [Chara braunii]|eukprot:GBG63402.1 hypothetical protein CBR_g38025 [Chara braunii]
MARVREFIGRCYDKGVCPEDINLGRVVEDEEGKRFVVEEAVDEVKEQWLKERSVVVIFQGEARKLARSVKEDLIRAYEDGWSARRLFAPKNRTGRVKFEGQNVASYVARAKEIADWLVKQKELKITLGKDGYLVQFRPRLSKQELQDGRFNRIREEKGADNREVAATHAEGLAVREELSKTSVTSRSKVRWGSECSEDERRASHKQASSSSVQSSAASSSKKREEQEVLSRQRWDKRADAIEKNQMETVQRCVIPLLCTKANEVIYFLAITGESGTPVVPSMVVDQSPTPSRILEITRRLYGEHVPVQLIPHSVMASVLCETVQGYSKMYFPLLDARISEEIAGTLAQSGIRWMPMSLIRERNVPELEAIQVLPGISTLVLLNVNEKLLAEENLHSEFLAASLTKEWRASSKTSLSRSSA